MSEYTRDAGMICRYEIICQSMSCRQSHYIGTTDRRTCASEARRAGWQYIRGAWYCAKCSNERRQGNE